jgi:type IV secretion system protein VirB2
MKVGKDSPVNSNSQFSTQGIANMKFASVISKSRKVLSINLHNKRENRQAAMFVGVFAIVCAAVVPEIAAAAPWDSTATKILEIFTGGLTRTIAIIAVIACGIAAMAGKLSWDWAIKIIVGIVLVFGGTAFVDYIISAAS